MKLQDYDVLTPIIARTRQIRLYDMLLQEALPNDLTGRVEVLNVRDGQLIVGAANAAIATRMRYQQANWLDGINAARANWPGLAAVTGMTVRVQPPSKRRKPLPKRHRPAEEIGQGFRQLADHDSDPNFRRVMKRLAALSGKDSGSQEPEDN